MSTKRLIHTVLIGVVFLMTVLPVFGAGNGEKNSDARDAVAMWDYEGVQGTVLIPKNPQRVVADYYVGELIKLEASLVGADLTYKSSAWPLGDLADVGQSMESVMGLNPDLIITINEEKVPLYEGIAPTIYLPYGSFNPEDLMRELSVITGTEEIAQKWIDDFNEKIDELALLIPDVHERYTIIDVWGGNAYFYGEHFGRGGYILYNKLDLKGTEAAERDYIRKADSYANLAVESLPDYAGNVILLMSNEDPREAGSFFMNNVVWENLPSVISDSVYFLNSADFWFVDPFSLDLQVELLKEIFSE